MLQMYMENYNKQYPANNNAPLLSNDMGVNTSDLSHHQRTLTMPLSSVHIIVKHLKSPFQHARKLLFQIENAHKYPIYFGIMQIAVYPIPTIDLLHSYPPLRHCI